MKLTFKDQAFSFELLRAVGYAPYGGADLGECLATAERIKERDLESWHKEWLTTAERIQAIAEEALANQHAISAREAFLRASNYYRTAEFFLHVDPTDPRVTATWQTSRACFASAACLFSPPFEAVEIPFEDTSLPVLLQARPHVDAEADPLLSRRLRLDRRGAVFRRRGGPRSSRGWPPSSCSTESSTSTTA